MKTVLVVEDTDDLRELFVEILRGAGYDALGAEHGQAALAMLHSLRDPPRLVLLDMMMPVMDGHAFLSALHETHRFDTLPVVVVSAMLSQADVTGARRLVKKPISPETLLQVVRDFCGPP